MAFVGERRDKCEEWGKKNILLWWLVIKCLGSQTQPFATAKSDISNNTRPFQNLSELGLTKLTYFATSDLNTAEKENFSLIYVKEVIGLFNLVTFPSLLSVSQFKEHGC